MSAVSTARRSSVTRPGVPAAVVAALRDLLEQPLPLIAANVVWAAVAFIAWIGWLVSPVWGIAVSVVLAWPAVVVATLAARVVRGEPVGLRDAVRWPLSRMAVPLLGLGATLVVVIALVDIAAGLASADALGLALATLAAWGLVALAVVACIAWPLLGDSRRERHGARRILRLAVSVAFLHTLRCAVTTIIVTILLIASAVLVAPLVSVSVSLAALILSRIVLPLADTVDVPPEPIDALGSPDDPDAGDD